MADRPTRRHVLAGVGSALAAASLPGCPTTGEEPGPEPTPTPETCSPGGTATGLRGNHPTSTVDAHRLRLGGQFDPDAIDVVDDGETVDLLVIGAGFSGLSAAIGFGDERPDASVLILDNHDEFGGHARRNTFEVDGTTLVAGGGTYELESHEWGPFAARQLLERIGLRPEELAGYWDASLLETLELSSGFFSDEQSHGVPASWARDMFAVSWQAFFEQTSLSEEVRADLTALCDSDVGPAGLSVGALGQRSYRDYIEGDMGLGPEATRFADIFAKDWFGVGADQLVASAMLEGGPGLTWAASDWTPDPAWRYLVMAGARYPDGMHTVLRGLLAELIPAAFSATDSLDALFGADVCEDAFEAGSVRLRLGATAMVVRHDGDPDSAERVEVIYLKQGQARRVWARQVVMAGGGFVARRILTDLPEDNLAGAEAMVHCPMVYANVALRSWEPVAEAGVSSGVFLGDIYQVFMLQHPIYPPGWQAPFDPARPITLMLTGAAIGEGDDVEAQAIAGRERLDAMSHADHEEEVASTLERLFGAHGFDRSLIADFTVNQYGHGYGFFEAVTHLDGYEAASRPWGRISIAHTDSEGQVWAHAAIEAGLRAAAERLAHGS